jgi:hypothetical protein
MRVRIHDVWCLRVDVHDCEKCVTRCERGPRVKTCFCETQYEDSDETQTFFWQASRGTLRQNNMLLGFCAVLAVPVQEPEPQTLMMMVAPPKHASFIPTDGSLSIRASHPFYKVTQEWANVTRHRLRLLNTTHVALGKARIHNETHMVDDTLVFAGGRRLVADHQYAEVIRFAVACSATAEGWSAGFPADCGSGYNEIGRPELASCDKHNPPANVSYGCWFFFSDPYSAHFANTSHVNITSGSGVSVNVGRSLRVDSRGEASAALGLPCADPPLCEKEGTVQDKLYCERAVKLGYDSIQFARPHSGCLTDACFYGSIFPPPELVMCTGSCMSKTIVDACIPDLKYKRVGSDEPCECSSESHVLNCGKGALLYGRADNGEQKCDRTMKGITSPELFEFIELLITPELQPRLLRTQSVAMQSVRTLMRFNSWYDAVNGVIKVTR